MPRKSKPRKPRSTDKADPLKVEFSMRGRGKVPTAEQARAIFLTWANGGALPEGIRIKFVRWQNPARKSEALRNWREAHSAGEIRHARETLRLRGWLHGAQINIAQVRPAGIQGEPTPDLAGLRPGEIPAPQTGVARSVPRPKNVKPKRKKRAVPKNKAWMARGRGNKRKVKRTGKGSAARHPKKR